MRLALLRCAASVGFLSIALIASERVCAQVVVGQAEHFDTSKPLRELAEDAKKADESRKAQLGKGATAQEQTLLDFLKMKHPAALEHGERSALTGGAAGKAFPKVAFFALRFRQWPVVRENPAGFAASNVCAITGEGVQIISDAAGLDKFFRAQLGNAKGDDERRLAMQAWLQLSEELHQDGFYKFKKIEDQSIKITRDAVTGKAEIEAQGGNQGEIAATLTFDAHGHLASAKEQAKLLEGVRPICQATKLLDPDAIVRRIAQRDILIMGSMACDYLLEQRAKATPELQAAIDAVWDQIRAEGR